MNRHLVDTPHGETIVVKYDGELVHTISYDTLVKALQERGTEYEIEVLDD